MNSLLPIQARKSLKKLCNRKYSTFGNLQVKYRFENTNRSLNCCKYLHIPLENQEAPETQTANPLENFYCHLLCSQSYRMILRNKIYL